MNKKIKELYKQSINDADHIYYPGDIPDVFVERFAELIVRECADVCDELAEKLEEQRPNKGYSDSAWHCAEIIKEHFGVES